MRSWSEVSDGVLTVQEHLTNSPLSVSGIRPFPTPNTSVATSAARSN